MADSNETAELDALFGVDFEDDDETETEVEVETPEVEAEESEEEGERPAPAGPATSKETPDKEVAPSPETEEEGDDAVRDPRIRKMLERDKKYRKYEPLLELMEEDPQLARRVAERRLLGREEAPAPAAPAAPAQPTQAEITAYWQKRIADEPEKAIPEFLQAAVVQSTRSSRIASAQSVVLNYKSQRRASDPLFKHYEPIFDALIKHADPDVIIDPDKTEMALESVETLALGTWAKEQRKKRTAAEARSPKLKREEPVPIVTSKGPKPTTTAKPKRALTPEEQMLADRYGADLVDTDDDKEESVWGRR